MAPINLKGLRAQAYEHPTDTATLNVLTHTAGLDTLVRKLNSWGFEQLLRVQLTGSYLRTSPDSMSDLRDLLATARERLDMAITPDLYVAGGELNAVTAGAERPLMVVYSGAIEKLTPQEMLFVMSHEMGHINSNHVLYYQIAEFLPAIAEAVGTVTLGIGELLGTGLKMALLHWKRMAEFTADRAGLLGCQDPDAATRTLMKMAGLPGKYYPSMNTEDFLRQAREFENLDAETLSKVAKWFSGMGATHPWTVMRAQQLLLWVDRGEYDAVLRAPQKVAVRLPPGIVGYCDQCGFPLRGNEAFCSGCGRALARATGASG
jgi:Zn-dependent protease with chaperone function